jgi:hypothetical protein
VHPCGPRGGLDRDRSKTCERAAADGRRRAQADVRRGRQPDELGALVQEVSEVARALAQLALAETALSALALRRVVLLRLLLMVAVVLAVVFLGGAGLIALANLLESMAAAFAIYGVLFLALAAFAAVRAKAWRQRIGYAETRAPFARASRRILAMPRNAALVERVRKARASADRHLASLQGKRAGWSSACAPCTRRS